MQIENKILSGVFNFFDMPVRFTYSHFSLFRRMMYKRLYSSNFKELDLKFEFFKTILNKNDISIQNKVILEIGPGNSLIFAYNFLLSGAEKIILVDKYPLNAFQNSNENSFQTEKLQNDYFYKEKEFIIKKVGYEKAKNLFAEIKSKKRIEYIASDLSEIKSIEPVDIMVSNSVFEHIKNPELSVLASSNILRKDGYAFHSIDLRDHYNFKRPFLFYKYSDKFWEKYMTRLGVSYTNRIRYNDFIKMFEKTGFKILFQKKNSIELKEKRISSCFRDRNDLSVSHVDLLVQNKQNKAQ